MFSTQVFRANDIRGMAETELTNEFAYLLGKCFAKRVKTAGESQVMLCRDARLSSPRLHTSLIEGISSEGLGIVDIGIGPTPLLAFGLSQFAPVAVKSGIMITASHNPPEQNGFKITLSLEGFYGEQLEFLQEQMNQESSHAHVLSEKENRLNLTEINLESSYVANLIKDIPDLSGMKIVVDAANGAAGPLAVKVFRALNIEVIEQFCEPDGRFPNRSPDTGNPANLELLRQKVLAKNAMLGVGFDGDGDRMVAVTAAGKLLNADEMIGLFSKSTLQSMPESAIVFDVKCSPKLTQNILSMGGKPIMFRSGRSFIQTKMKETNASFAGEYSAHYFFGDRWTGSDDGIYAACRLIELCKNSNRSLEQLCNTFSVVTSATVATDEIRLNAPDKDKFNIVEKLLKSGNFQINNQNPNVIDIDGLRLEYPSGWILIRASNTSSTLTLRLESESKEFLELLAVKAVELFAEVAPQLSIKKEHILLKKEN